LGSNIRHHLLLSNDVFVLLLSAPKVGDKDKYGAHLEVLAEVAHVGVAFFRDRMRVLGIRAKPGEAAVVLQLREVNEAGGHDSRIAKRGLHAALLWQQARLDP
jgi:hypothetical protein